MFEFLTRLFGKKKNYYNDDDWSFIEETNQWEKSKGKKKLKKKKVKTLEEYKSVNPFDILATNCN